MVACLYFEFNVSAEHGVVVTNGSSWYELLAGCGNYFIEVFGREVDVVVVRNLVRLKFFFYCSCEFVPVSSFVVCVCGFGCASVRCGECERDRYWEVIG